MPLPVADRHPSGSILSTGGELRLQSLPPNSRIPLLSTVTTVGAVAIAGTSVTLTTVLPVLLDAEFDLPFAAGTLITGSIPSWVVPTVTTAAAVVAGATTISITAAAAFILPSGAQMFFGSVMVETTAETLIGTTATTVPIRPVAAAIATATASVNTVSIRSATVAIPATAASSPFLPLLSLLGIQSVSRPQKTNLISIRSFKSGLGNEQRPTMVDFTCQIQGWVHQRDQSFRRVIEPAGRLGLEVYGEYYSAQGRVMRGACFVSDTGIEEKNDDVLKYNFTLGFQGIPFIGDF